MKMNTPFYKSPPVVETVIGVSFAPIKLWDIQHFGLFWSNIRDEFPEVAAHPPLESLEESFPQSPRRLGLQFTNKPDARCWYMNANDQTLLQVQRDRFILNWRRGDTEKPYPRYADTIRPAFIRQWGRFSDFITSEFGHSLSIRQCEMSYINQIPLSADWVRPSELFAGWSGETTESFLPPEESLRLNVSYKMPDNRGRLRIAAGHAVTPEGTEIVQMDLTCRGKPVDATFPAALDLLDFGHEWIVRGFTDFTTSKMHRTWKRED